MSSAWLDSNGWESGIRDSGSNADGAQLVFKYADHDKDAAHLHLLRLAVAKTNLLFATV